MPVLAFFFKLKIGTSYKNNAIAIAISQIRIVIAGILKVKRLMLYRKRV